MICTKRNCNRRNLFMDSDRCFEHYREAAWFSTFFALTLVLTLAMTGLTIWAVISLVQWVTSK